MSQNGVRINKYIATSGICSRRKADDLILNGNVKLNGQVVKEPGVMVMPKDKVSVNNQIVSVRHYKYVAFHKPAGYITTKKDENKRKTIYDILPKEFAHLNPVGRLDRESSGLLIMTNNGDLHNKLTHPSLKVKKIYIVSVQGKVKPHDLNKLAEGFEIEQGQFAYADVELTEYLKDSTMLKITLYQGYNRQIRKMMDIIGHPVISLKRIAHASITLQGIKKGEYTQLKPKQVTDLKNYIKNIEKND